ncbi:MAG TPA: serine proteinase inhibitor [Clostridiales bacterium]|nr:serine proteinase inhibitor [Clostridiales bacterium]
MRRFFTFTALALVFVMVLTGCAPAVAGDLMANVKAAEKPSSPAEPDQAYIDSVSDFSFNLLRESLANKGNLLVSPASVYLALAMTLNGSDTTTRAAMLAALSASGLDLDQMNSVGRDWMTLLMNTDGKTKLSIANSIWFREGFDADPAFLQRNADYYSAAARALNFADPGAVGIINGWVKTATNGTIDKIVERIDSDVVMYLINAIYFKAEWQQKFIFANTRERAFQAPDGEEIVKFMHDTRSMTYLDDGSTTGVLLPYSDGRYAFVALLPDEGTDARTLAADMKSAMWSNLLSSRREVSVELALPKFEVRYEDSLVGEMTALGMGEAFEGGKADFSLINAGRRKDLYISEIKHKTFIRVDEEGTEAAAVTSVEIRETSAPMRDVQLTFDRPFIYALVDTVTGLPLFIGILEEVTSNK